MNDPRREENLAIHYCPSIDRIAGMAKNVEDIPVINKSSIWYLATCHISTSSRDCIFFPIQYCPYCGDSLDVSQHTHFPHEASQ